MAVVRTTQSLESARPQCFRPLEPGRWRSVRERRRRRLWKVDLRKTFPALWRHGNAEEEARAQAKAAAKAARHKPRRIQN